MDLELTHARTPAVYFDRSPETNEVLWFSAPPLHIARPPAAKHSLKYLAYLARKRKEGEGVNEMDGDGDGDGEEEDTEKKEDEEREDKGKRSRVSVAPTVSEMMQSAMDVVSW